MVSHHHSVISKGKKVRNHQVKQDQHQAAVNDYLNTSMLIDNIKMISQEQAERTSRLRALDDALAYHHCYTTANYAA